MPTKYPPPPQCCGSNMKKKIKIKYIHFTKLNKLINS